MWRFSGGNGLRCRKAPLNRYQPTKSSPNSLNNFVVKFWYPSSWFRSPIIALLLDQSPLFVSHTDRLFLYYSGSIADGQTTKETPHPCSWQTEISYETRKSLDVAVDAFLKIQLMQFNCVSCDVCRLNPRPTGWCRQQWMQSNDESKLCSLYYIEEHKVKRVWCWETWDGGTNFPTL